MNETLINLFKQNRAKRVFWGESKTKEGKFGRTLDRNNEEMWKLGPMRYTLREAIHAFFYKQHFFYKQSQTEIGKKLNKT